MISEVNHTKRILREGKTALGTMVTTFRVPAIIPMMAAAGWDYIILDNEHNAFDAETIQTMALLAGYEDLSLLVRIPSLEYHHVARTLDLGVDGLVVPHVETAEDAEMLVRSSTYYPRGERGASLASRIVRFPDLKASEYLDWANREILLAVQIETGKGVLNAEEILAVEGLDAVMIGPFDLSQSLGCPGEMENPEVLKACREVIRACSKFGVSSGIHIQTTAAARFWKSEGMSFITCQTDAGMMNLASSGLVSSLKGFD